MSQSKAQLLDPQGDLTLPGLLIGVGATFSGNVSIGGTLTKQDVTNVDSVGLITARSGIEVTGGDITIPDKIVHLGDVDTCIRFPGTDIITMERSGSEVFRLDSSGLKIPDKLIHQGDIDTFLEFGTDTINFDTGGTERLRITSGGELRIGGNEGGYRTNIIRESSDTTTAETQLLLYAKHDGSGNTGVGYGGGIRFWGDRNGDNAEQNMGRIMCTADVNSGTTISGALSFETAEAGVLSEKARITSDGKIGIGTAIPIKKFDVRGTGNQGILIGSYDNSGAQLIIDGNGDGDAGGGNYGALEHKSNGDFTIRNHDASQSMIFGVGSASGANDSLVINSSQNATFAGNVSDSKGDIRSIPKLIKSSNHTLVATDAGCAVFVNAAANVTVNNGVLTLGDAVTIVNHHSADITIIQDSGMTMYNSNNAATGNRTLASRGMATIWFAADDTAYISGSGLS